VAGVRLGGGVREGGLEAWEFESPNVSTSSTGSAMLGPTLKVHPKRPLRATMHVVHATTTSA
jgi:hypothetical protein